jgi:hypothetical protein
MNRSSWPMWPRERYDLVEEAVSGISGLTMSHVEDAYLAWIDARDSGIENPGAYIEVPGVDL